MKRNNTAFIVLGLLSLLDIFAWIFVSDLSKPRFLEVNFFDVGQGDAIFIETPQSHQILIDGGPDSAILGKLAAEMPFWDRTIDLVILTHPERDHLVGLLEVLKRYKIENILWTGVVRDTSEYNEWLNLIKGEGAEVKIAKGGQKITAPRTVLEVLYPFESFVGQEFKDSNNTSIITRLVFGEDSFLFTGDVSKSVEKKLIETEANLNADVLKVAHHGSKTSTAEKFIEKILPEVATILVSKDNRYGHPHRETLETLKKYGIKVLRTDLNGDIKIISNGINFKIE